MQFFVKRYENGEAFTYQLERVQPENVFDVFICTLKKMRILRDKQVINH
jgi:hypothetical protein